MTTVDEHAILRSLEDIRIACAMAPETPATMRLRAEVREQVEWERKRRERQRELNDMKRERIRDQRIEAWKAGDPLPKPAPPYDPYPDMARVAFMSASCYPTTGTGAMPYYPPPLPRDPTKPSRY